MAGNNDYLIPFGIDTAPFKKGVAEIDAGTDAMTANVMDSTKAMQKGFNDAAGAGEKLGNTLTVDAEKAAQLRETAKTLGKELGNALSGKNTGTDFEKKVQKFSDMLAKFSANASKPIKFNIDSEKLDAFEKALADGADELNILTLVLEEAQKQLQALDPNTQEWQALNAQIEIANGFLEGLGQAAAGAESKQKSLKGQLRELKAAMAAMEEAGQGDTEQFIQMAIRAGELEDQIGDVSARVRVLASDTKYIDAGVEALTALAGGFAVAQGAAALFGSENEEVNKVIQKVTGAMAILQGIQAVANALNKDSTLSVLLNTHARVAQTAAVTAEAAAETAEATAATAATAATEGFTAALLSNPVTAIAVGVAALVAALVVFTSGSSKAEEAQRRLNDQLERSQRLFDANAASIDADTALETARAKVRGASATELADIETRAAKRRLDNAAEIGQSAQDAYDKAQKNTATSAEDFKKFTDYLTQKEAAYNKALSDVLVAELNAKKVAIDEAKKAQDEQAKKDKEALENAKKLAEERKKIIDQQLKFTQELEKARIELIADSYDKEKAQAENNARQQISQLENEKSLSVAAEKTKQLAIIAIKTGLKKQLDEIDKKQVADTAALQMKAQEITISLREEGIVKEIETIRLSYEQKKIEITEQFKNEAILRDKLISQLNEAQIVEQKKAQDKFTNETIAKQEERAVLEVETAAKFLPDLPGIEEKKQIEVLKVKIKYAEQARQALIDQGNAENSTVVLQATKAVQELKKQLNVAVKDEKDAEGGVNWFDLLGLGTLTQQQRSQVQDSAMQMLDSITQVTNFIVDQYQRQIDKKKEVIDQIDDSIDDLEEQLDKEKDLREQGLANNVDAIQAELDATKKAREEEVKQAEDIQKKKQALAKAQLILDTAEQASNLVTASAKIFRSLADIPFVGVPLAIATIALMAGAFVTAKVKAFQVVNDQKQSFGEGGYIDGKPHTQGGRTYRATDGSGVVELEGGEYVTNKRSTAKYADLLEAINNDDIHGMNEDALRDMLAGLGIQLSNDAPIKVLKVVRERDDFKQSALMAEGGGSDISQDVQAISYNVKYLADKERDRVERWQDDENYFEKVGNKTTKIKKAKKA